MKRRTLLAAALVSAGVAWMAPAAAQVPLSLDDQILVARVQGYLDRVIAAFRGALERAVEKGQVRRDLDPAAAADVPRRARPIAPER